MTRATRAYSIIFLEYLQTMQPDMHIYVRAHIQEKRKTHASCVAVVCLHRSHTHTLYPTTNGNGNAELRISTLRGLATVLFPIGVARLF